MQKRRKKLYLLIITGIVLIIILAYFAQKHQLLIPAAEININPILENQTLPATDEAQFASNPESVKESGEEQTGTDSTIPDHYLLKMPFYSQAPYGKWDEFHEDMCEEASLLNAGLHLLDKKLSLEEYDRELEKMRDIEISEFGEWKSTTVAETKKLADEYFEGRISTKIIDNPEISDIETELAAGNPVVVPLAGREIGNPNFTPPGPLYHMLVIKGYNKQSFITNDVGTRKGESYIYEKNLLMSKIYDWNEEDIHLGEKRILVLYK